MSLICHYQQKLSRWFAAMLHLLTNGEWRRGARPSRSPFDASRVKHPMFTRCHLPSSPCIFCFWATLYLFPFVIQSRHARGAIFNCQGMSELFPLPALSAGRGQGRGAIIFPWTSFRVRQSLAPPKWKLQKRTHYFWLCFLTHKPTNQHLVRFAPQNDHRQNEPISQYKTFSHRSKRFVGYMFPNSLFPQFQIKPNRA